MAIDLGERKLWIQTRCKPREGWAVSWPRQATGVAPLELNQIVLAKEKFFLRQ